MEKFSVPISRVDIRANRNTTLNPFNDNDMYVVEYYAVESELSDRDKDWNDITRYSYDVGFVGPSHLKNGNMDMAVDGYIVHVWVK